MSKTKYAHILSTGVTFSFVQPIYEYRESVGVGTVCVQKVGLTDQPLTVMINGGW